MIGIVERGVGPLLSDAAHKSGGGAIRPYDGSRASTQQGLSAGWKSLNCTGMPVRIIVRVSRSEVSLSPSQSLAHCPRPYIPAAWNALR